MENKPVGVASLATVERHYSPRVIVNATTNADAYSQPIP